METSGAFGPSALALLSDIGRLIRAETGELKSHQFLLQAITVVVQQLRERSIDFGHCTCSGRCFYLDVDDFYGSLAVLCTAWFNITLCMYMVYVA